MARDIVEGFLDHMSNEDIVRVAASSGREHKARAMVLYGTEQRLEPVLEMLEKNTGQICRWYTFTHSVNGRDHYILMNHDMGQKWSVFVEAYMKSFFLEMLDISVRSSYMDNAVVLEFRV